MNLTPKGLRIGSICQFYVISVILKLLTEGFRTVVFPFEKKFIWKVCILQTSVPGKWMILYICLKKRIAKCIDSNPSDSNTHNSLVSKSCMIYYTLMHYFWFYSRHEETKIFCNYCHLAIITCKITCFCTAQQLYQILKKCGPLWNW